MYETIWSRRVGTKHFICNYRWQKRTHERERGMGSETHRHEVEGVEWDWIWTLSTSWYACDEHCQLSHQSLRRERERKRPKNGIKTYFNIAECFLDFAFLLVALCLDENKKLISETTQCVCRVAMLPKRTAAAAAAAVCAQLSTLLCARYDIILHSVCTLYSPRHDIKCDAFALESLHTQKRQSRVSRAAASQPGQTNE